MQHRSKILGVDNASYEVIDNCNAVETLAKHVVEGLVKAFEGRLSAIITTAFLQ